MTDAEILDLATRYRIPVDEACRMAEQIEAARKPPQTREERSRHYRETVYVAHRQPIAGTPVQRIWCTQCERNVTTAEGENCRSQWCKAKDVAA